MSQMQSQPEREVAAGAGAAGEAYLDIVWRQFRKNRFALVSLWLLVPMFLAAIFAPLVASNQPLVFHETVVSLVDGQDGRTLVYHDLAEPEAVETGPQAAAVVYDPQKRTLSYRDGQGTLVYHDVEKPLVLDRAGQTAVLQSIQRPSVLQPDQPQQPLDEGTQRILLQAGRQTLVRRQKDQTLVYREVGTPEVVAREAAPAAAPPRDALVFAFRDKVVMYRGLGEPAAVAPGAGPLVVRQQRTLFPWFRALFNPEEAVDFAFNMALVGFFPWLVLALGLDWLWKRHRVAGRRRMLRVTGLYLAIIVGLIAVFCFPKMGSRGDFWTPAVRPKNKYAARAFSDEQAQSPATRHGVYVPIPYGPTQQDLAAVYEPPMSTKDSAAHGEAGHAFPHVLGTDDSGRDVLVRMIYGSRISLTVGFVAVGIYTLIGVVVGAVAGYFGGKIDILISRIIEIMLLFPSFFLILILVGLLGQSIYIIMVVIGLTGWPTIARLIRGEVLKQRSIDYVAAARALGSSSTRIIFRHILPNAISPALVAVPFGIANAIVAEAGLSLLGFGVKPPAPSWGSLLQLGNGNYSYWWLIVVPSFAIFVTVTVFNLVGAGLRDAMDPRLRA